MRVLVATVPHPTHFFHIVPYAQALQNAGHEVCVVTPPGGMEGVLSAGLTGVSFGEPLALSSLANWKKHGLLPSQEMREKFADAFGLDAAERDHWDVFYQYYSLNSRFFLPSERREDIDGMVDFARMWRPDLVLWESWFPIGGVIARACGAAHARILLAPDYAGWSVELFADRGSAVSALGGNPLVEALEPVAARYGLPVDEDLLLAQRSIDPMPIQLRLSKRIKSIPVRGISFNGGSVKPEWLFGQPERPRLAVSLGLSVRLWQAGGDTRVPKVMEAVDGLDIEVVATLSENQLSSTPKVPDNVRVVEFVPLTQLLPTCSAIVYHGASGTYRAAEAVGIPQMIIDTDEPHRQIFSGEGDDITVTNADRHQDSWFTSRYITERGAGIRMNHQKQSSEEIRTQLIKLLEDPRYREGAQALRREWLAKPSPAEIIPDLTALTGERA